jgi:hypothetical protein
VIDDNFGDAVTKLIETSPHYKFVLARPEDPIIRQDIGTATKEFFSRYISVVGPGGHFSRSHLRREFRLHRFVLLGDMDGAMLLSRSHEEPVYWTTALDVIPELSVEDYLEGEDVIRYDSVYHLILDFAIK